MEYNKDFFFKKWHGVIVEMVRLDKPVSEIANLTKLDEKELCFYIKDLKKQGLTNPSIFKIDKTYPEYDKYRGFIVELHNLEATSTLIGKMVGIIPSDKFNRYLLKIQKDGEINKRGKGKRNSRCDIYKEEILSDWNSGLELSEIIKKYDIINAPGIRSFVLKSQHNGEAIKKIGKGSNEKEHLVSPIVNLAIDCARNNGNLRESLREFSINEQRKSFWQMVYSNLEEAINDGEFSIGKIKEYIAENYEKSKIDIPTSKTTLINAGLSEEKANEFLQNLIYNDAIQKHLNGVRINLNALNSRLIKVGTNEEKVEKCINYIKKERKITEILRNYRHIAKNKKSIEYETMVSKLMGEGLPEVCADIRVKAMIDSVGRR